MIGQKLGPYTILEFIGAGTLGSVYKAETPEGRLVALKYVSSKILDTRQKREQFLCSALACSELRLPSLCPILEIGDDNDDLFVVTPFLNGRTLAEYAGKKPVQLSKALEIALAVGTEIAAIHDAHAVHQALKPTNIWIFENEQRQIMLTDCFMQIPGNAAPGELVLKNAGVPGTGQRSGSVSLYLSPEQIWGGKVDQRTDIFSFGIIFYELITGRHPFEARDASECAAKIMASDPPPLPLRSGLSCISITKVVERALRKNRTDRYPTMAALLSELQKIASNQRGSSSKPAAFRRHIVSKLLSPLRSRMNSF